MEKISDPFIITKPILRLLCRRSGLNIIIDLEVKYSDIALIRAYSISF